MLKCAAALVSATRPVGFAQRERRTVATSVCNADARIFCIAVFFGSLEVIVRIIPRKLFLAVRILYFCVVVAFVNVGLAVFSAPSSCAFTLSSTSGTQAIAAIFECA